jgi:hypothetical protein
MTNSKSDTKHHLIVLIVAPKKRHRQDGGEVDPGTAPKRIPESRSMPEPTRPGVGREPRELPEEPPPKSQSMIVRRRGGRTKHVEGEDGKSGRRLDRPGRACKGGRMADGGMASGGKWIQGAIKHPGALHEQLGVPQGEKIPEKKLTKAAHSDNPTLARRARLAETLKGMHHKKD